MYMYICVHIYIYISEFQNKFFRMVSHSSNKIIELFIYGSLCAWFCQKKETLRPMTVSELSIEM